MCCRCPGPWGGAQSTDTGPAHGPAVCSLPVTQHTCQIQKNKEASLKFVFSNCDCANRDWPRVAVWKLWPLRRPSRCSIWGREEEEESKEVICISIIMAHHQGEEPSNWDADSYFEIWVWKASILVRVLVRSSNTFSWWKHRKIQILYQTHPRTGLAPLVLTCTATPKLLPSSILGIWSCTHMDTCEIGVSNVTERRRVHRLPNTPSKTLVACKWKTSCEMWQFQEWLTVLSVSFSVWIWGLTTWRRPSIFSLLGMGPQGGPGGQIIPKCPH